MSTPYIPPPLKPIRQLKPLTSSALLPLTLPLTASTEDVILTPVNYSEVESSDCDSNDDDDPYAYVNIPPTVLINRPPCAKCGCTQRLSGYGIQFNPDARYDGAESHITVCCECNALLSYQL